MQVHKDKHNVTWYVGEVVKKTTDGYWQNDILTNDTAELSYP